MLRQRFSCRLRPALGGAWVLGVLAGVMVSQPAFADDSAAAEQLFLDAKALADAEQWAEACPKFQASLDLDRTLGTLLNLADCNEKVGKVASAWSQFGEAEQWAARLRDERQQFAADRQSALEPRLSRLTITVHNPVATLSVYRDESALSSAELGTAIPVDPGAHVVVVKRGTESLERRDLTLAEASTGEIVLDLGAIAAAHPAVTPPVGPAVQSTVTKSTPPQPDYWNGQRVTGLIVGSAGLLGLVHFGVMEGLAASNHSALQDDGKCSNGNCSPEGAERSERAETLATAGQWVGIVSGVVFLVGATIFLTAPTPTEGETAGAWVAPYAGPEGGGLSLRGWM